MLVLGFWRRVCLRLRGSEADRIGKPLELEPEDSPEAETSERADMLTSLGEGMALIHFISVLLLLSLLLVCRLKRPPSQWLSLPLPAVQW